MTGGCGVVCMYVCVCVCGRRGCAYMHTCLCVHMWSYMCVCTFVVVRQREGERELERWTKFDKGDNQGSHFHSMSLRASLALQNQILITVFLSNILSVIPVFL